MKITKSQIIPGSLWFWALTLVSFTLGLSALISTGPSIQSYVLSLISSDRVSIYATAYSDNLIKFPGLRDWVVGYLFWPYLVMSGFIVLFALPCKSYRSVFSVSSTLFFILQSALDICNSALDKTISYSIVFENLIFNLFGGIVLGGIILGILILGEIFYRHWPAGIVTRRLVFAIIPVAVGFFGSLCAFFIIKLLYDPVPVRLDVFLSAPIRGFVYYNKTSSVIDKKSTGDDTKPFKLISNASGSGEVYWDNPVGPLKAIWHSPKSNEIFDATASIFAGCPYMLPEKTINPAYSLSFKDVKALSFWFDQGPVGFWSGDKKYQRGEASFNSVGPSYFWVTKKGSKLSIMQEINENSSLNFYDNEGKLRMYMNALLFVDKKNGEAPGGRKLHILYNGKNITLSFIASSKVNMNDKISCRQILSNDIFRGSNPLRLRSLVAGVLIQIVPRASGDIFYLPNQNVIHIVGKSGWVDLDNINARTPVFSTSIGPVSIFQFGGNIDRMSIDGIRVNTYPQETFTVLRGQMNGAFVAPGELEFTGVAKYLYKNQVRFNRTRWEKFPPKYRYAALAAVVAIIAYMVRSLVLYLRNDGSISALYD